MSFDHGGESRVALPAHVKRNHKVSGTLAAPAREDCIIACSKVLHRHILTKDSANSDESEDQQAFDIDNFVKRSYNVNLAVLPKVCGWTVYRQKLKINKVPIPDEEKIHSFIKKICDQARLNPEAVIIALIYIERLMESEAINLSARNWIPLVSIALLTGSKVWDDHSSWNAEFAEILPFFTLSDINNLERRFLVALDYMLAIPPSEYARYYFGLRALKKKDNAIPKYYLKLNISAAARLAAPPKVQKEDIRALPMSL